MIIECTLCQGPRKAYYELCIHAATHCAGNGQFVLMPIYHFTAQWNTHFILSSSWLHVLMLSFCWSMQYVRGSPPTAVMIHVVWSKYTWLPFGSDTIGHEAKHLLAHQLMWSVRRSLAGLHLSRMYWFDKCRLIKRIRKMMQLCRYGRDVKNHQRCA